MDLIYIVGPPASGKSTLMRELTGGCQKVQRDRPLAYQQLVHPLTADVVGFELGRPRPDYPGTDTLPMNVAPVAKRWIADLSAYPRVAGTVVVLGEGDRLGFLGFFEAALGAGVNVTLVHLTCEGETLDSRCEERGSAQNEVWRRGRATKALRTAELAATHGAKVVRLDSTSTSPAALVKMLRANVPCLSVLPGRPG